MCGFMMGENNNVGRMLFCVASYVSIQISAFSADYLVLVPRVIFEFVHPVKKNQPCFPTFARVECVLRCVSGGARNGWRRRRQTKSQHASTHEENASEC